MEYLAIGVGVLVGILSFIFFRLISADWGTTIIVSVIVGCLAWWKVLGTLFG